MKSRLEIYSKRLALASFAVFAVTACQSGGGDSGSGSGTSSTAPANALNAVCNPFGSGGSGPQNGLQGTLSYLPHRDHDDCKGLDDFDSRANKITTPIYLPQLDITTQAFLDGFIKSDGNKIKDDEDDELVQNFALHLQSNIRLTSDDAEGAYQFALISDNGARVDMDLGDGNGFVRVVDNDGYHETGMGCAHQSVPLTHSSNLPLKLDFYQARDEHLALILLWRKVDPNSNWHDDNDDKNNRCDADGADPLNDSDCDRSDDSMYFDWEHFPSVGNDNWNRLQARGWKIVPPQNFFLSAGTPNPCGQPTQCYSDTFNQPKNLNANSVDLLFMTDSASDDYERSAVASHLHTFLNQLPQGVDTNVGVMVGYGAKGGKAGLLTHASSVPPVLSTKTLAVSDIEKMLAKTLNHIPDDFYSGDGELPLYSVTQALTGPDLQANQAQGILRPDAALSVIFLSDDHDQCAADPSSYRECNGVTPASVLAQLQAFKGNLPLTVNTIAHTTHWIDPYEQEDEYGAGIIDIATLAHGVIVNMVIGQYEIDQTNYDQGLQQMGQALAAKLLPINSGANLQHDFTLSHRGIDPSTLAVSVDGATAQYTYDPNQDQVDLTSAGSYGSVIKVNYCLASTSPSPSPTASTSPSPSPTVSTSPSPSPTVSTSPSPSPSPSCTGPFCGGGPLGT